MSSILSTLSKGIRKAYRKAEGFIEEEREIPVSQVFLNATLKRYVTDNVELLQDLHADVHDDWLRLYASVSVQGLVADLAVDLKLLQMIFNKDNQLLVFEQISNTQVVNATFKNVFQKMLAKSALFFYQKVLKKDPLGPILQRFDVVQMQEGLLYLDLNQWLGDKRSIVDALHKVHVNHAELREGKLVLIGNLNLSALFSRSRDWESLEDASNDLAAVNAQPESDSSTTNGNANIANDTSKNDTK